MTGPVENTSPRPRASTPVRWLLVGGLVLAGAMGAAVIGAPPGDEAGPGAVAGVAAVAFAGLTGGVLAAIYLCAGAGLGRTIVRAACGEGTGRRELEFFVGLAAMLVISHLMGWLGILTALSAWAVVGVGVVTWVFSVVGTRPGKAAGGPGVDPRWWLLGVPPAAVMLCAASSPPGWLWTSEAGGYDVLSYHLELVREWVEGGRLVPLAHNVYSYLPGYGEGAFLHLAHMAVPLRSVIGGLSSSVGGLPEAAILGAAWLHGMLAIAAAVGLARAAAMVVPSLGEGRGSSVLAGVAVVATPWVVVTGSMAYNDLFVVALGVGCVLAAVTPGVSAIARGVLIGLMGSCAVGAKPTAFFMLAPVVLTVLVIGRGLTGSRDWARFAVLALVAGTLAAAPWLARNAIASGNPVFPFAHTVFGDGPWTSEQHARHAAAHRFEGSVGERFEAAAALPGGTDAKTHGLGGQPRGVFHEQWSILFPVGVGGLALGLASGRTRRAAGLTLGALGLQVGAWLFLTHVQSRFLLTCVIPLGLGVAIGVDALRDLLAPGSRAGVVALGIGAACVAWLGARSVLIFAEERSGRPNATLAFGVEGRTGEPLEHEFLHMPPEARRENLAQLPDPETFVNIGGLDELLPPAPASEGASAGLYLFGDATPFYFANPRVPVIYTTTYDTPAWGTSADPAAWVRALRERGVSFVLVNSSEIARLRRSGWYDPGVTPELVEKFVSEHTRVVAAWPRRGQRLCVLADAPTSASPHPVPPTPAGTAR